jgi:hypothetical protein
MQTHPKRVLARNARQSDPMPVCPRCTIAYNVGEHGTLFPALCNQCECERISAFIGSMIGRWGVDGAKRQFRALTRIRPSRPS